MKSLSYSLILMMLILDAATAKCAPSSMSIQFKSKNGERIAEYQLCNLRWCGKSFLTLIATCSFIQCFPIVSWNNYFASLGAKDLPSSLTGRLGIFFESDLSRFYGFDPDWPGAESEWYARNRWYAGCKSRFGCFSRELDRNLDVAMMTQACSTTLYRIIYGKPLAECVNGKFFTGVPRGEVYGTDCTALPLWKTTRSRQYFTKYLVMLLYVLG